MRKILILLFFSFSVYYSQNKVPVKKNTVSPKPKVTTSKIVEPAVQPPSLREQQTSNLVELIEILLSFPVFYKDYNPMLYKKPILSIEAQTDTSAIILHKNYLNQTLFKMLVSFDSSRIKQVDTHTMVPREKMIYKDFSLIKYRFEYSGKRVSKMTAITDCQDIYPNTYVTGSFYWTNQRIDSVHIKSPNFGNVRLLYDQNNRLENIYTSWSSSNFRYENNSVTRVSKDLTSDNRGMDQETTLFNDNFIINETRNIYNLKYPNVEIIRSEYILKENRLDTLVSRENRFGKEDENICTNKQIFPTKTTYKYNEKGIGILGLSEYHDNCRDFFKTTNYGVNESGQIIQKYHTDKNNSRCQY